MTRDDTPGLKDWNPISPTEVPALFIEYPGRWAIAGGWAIDLYLGRQTREHGDVDIQIDRRDIGFLHQALPGWLLYLAHGDLTLWQENDPIPAGIDNLWCRLPGGPWRFQLMLGPFTDTEWQFRRDPEIAGPIASFTIVRDGIPVVAPEIQLLYKSRSPILDKDQHDFVHALPYLGKARQSWLASSLSRLYEDHPWRSAIQEYRARNPGDSPARPCS